MPTDIAPRRFSRAGASTPATGSCRRGDCGLTLVEVMVVAALSAILLASLIQVYLTLGRSSVNLANYSVLEQHARRGLEIFAVDARGAAGVQWNDPAVNQGGKSIILTIPPVEANDPPTEVMYYYDTDSSSPHYRSFCRRVKSADDASFGPPTVLVGNVGSFGIDRFKTGTFDAAGKATAALNDLETKQLQLTLTASRRTQTAANVTNVILSARYVMRNKTNGT
jgi:prepilin-type N-terminal cleavage/methylation domain-containing protein